MNLKLNNKRTNSASNYQNNKIPVLAGQLSIGDCVWYNSRKYYVTAKAGGKVVIELNFCGESDKIELLPSRMVTKYLGL